MQPATQRYGSKLRKYLTEKLCSGEGAVAAAPGRCFKLNRADGQRAFALSFQVTQAWSNYVDTDASGDPL